MLAVSRSARLFHPAHSTPLVTSGDLTADFKLAYGTCDDLRRPCVDCGLYTGCFCDGLPSPQLCRPKIGKGNRRPCAPCDRRMEICHFCRGVPQITSPAHRNRNAAAQQADSATAQRPRRMKGSHICGPFLMPLGAGPAPVGSPRLHEADDAAVEVQKSDSLLKTRSVGILVGSDGRFSPAVDA